MCCRSYCLFYWLSKREKGYMGCGFPLSLRRLAAGRACPPFPTLFIVVMYVCGFTHFYMLYIYFYRDVRGKLFSIKEGERISLIVFYHFIIEEVKEGIFVVNFFPVALKIFSTLIPSLYVRLLLLYTRFLSYFNILCFICVIW